MASASSACRKASSRPAGSTTRSARSTASRRAASRSVAAPSQAASTSSASTGRPAAAMIPSTRRVRDSIPPDSGQEEVAQVRRERRPGVHLGREQLLDQERVALRATGDRLHQGGRERLAADLLQESRHLAAVEPAQLDARRPAAALELRQDGKEGMAPVELVGAEGCDERRSPAAQASREVGEQLERGSVGPVDVLEHEDEGAGHTVEEAPDSLEHPAATPGTEPAPRGGRTEVREQRGQLRPGKVDELVGALAEALDEAAERLDEWRVWQKVGAELDTRAHGDGGPAGHLARCEVLDEAALANPGLAAEQDHRALGPDGYRLLQGAQLRLATHEDRAGATSAHWGTLPCSPRPVKVRTAPAK